MMKISSLILVSIMLFGLGSCRKLLPEPDKDTTAASEVNLAEMAFDALFKEVDNAAYDRQLMKTGPTITIDSSKNPRIMTLDYGNGTIGYDGVLRKGIIKVSWNFKYMQVGSIITITTQNFYQGGYKIEGQKTITNMGRNLAGNLDFSIWVTNGRITAPDNRSITYESVRNREWIAGDNSPLVWRDDVYLVSGSANGHTSNGKTYSLTIKRDLRVDLSCEFRITEGLLEIWPEDKDIRTVDYGNGTCDREITVAIDGKEYKVSR